MINPTIFFLVLILFSGLFYYGYRLIEKHKNRLEELIRQIERTRKISLFGKEISIGDLDNSGALKTYYHDADSRFIEGLPGLFLSLGLLGTFIGLSIALAGIGDDNTGDANVTSALGAKFITSILGLLCNIAFKMLKDRTYQFHYERFLYRVQVCILEAKAQRNNTTNNHLTTVSEKINSIDTQILKFTASIDSLVLKLEGSTDKFANSSEGFATSVGTFNEDTKVVLNEIQGIIKNSTSLMSDFSNKTKEIFDDPETGLNKRLANLQGALSHSIDAFGEKIDKRMEDLTLSTQGIKEISSKMTATQQSLSTKLGQISESGERLAENAQRALGNALTINDRLYGKEGEEGDIQKSFGRAIRQVVQTDEADKEHLIKKLLLQMEEIGRKIDALIPVKGNLVEDNKTE